MPLAVLGDWTTFRGRVWLTCQGPPNRRFRDTASNPGRRCGRSLFKLGPHDGPLEARYAGTRAEPPAEDTPYQLHYCRDCHSFTAVRRAQHEAQAS